MNKLYVVTMYRWGSRDDHSYVLGVYDDLKKAKREAKRERIDRGNNKYIPEILEFDLNVTKRWVAVLPLED